MKKILVILWETLVCCIIGGLFGLMFGLAF
jgi:hypothetical protein